MSAFDENTEARKEIIAKFRRSDADVGSPEVQVALLTRRLEEIAKHVKTNPMDVHSQRGMHQVISRRKRLLKYLQNTNFVAYKSTIEALGLRK